MKTSWRKSANYRTQELKIEGGKVIYKDYWDLGKNPNITEIPFTDILEEKWDFEILMQFDPGVLRELKAAISEIIADK